jgi:catechol 2,3-dioxygenase-like lactoylglutathione lyase family enzyme
LWKCARRAGPRPLIGVNPMPLEKIEHYLVLTDDIDATRDFYVNALGMHVGPRPSLGFAGYWVYLGDVPCIHIGEWRSYTEHSNKQGIPVSTRAAGTGPVDHIAFHARDYDEILGRLERNGINPQRNDPPGAFLRQLFLEDPNGVKLEINVTIA